MTAEEPKPATDGATADEATCAEAMADAMADRPGIRRVTLESKPARLTVRYDPDVVSADDAEASAERLGAALERGYERCTMRLRGMRCDACARAVEQRIRAMPGVRAVSINPATEAITIEQEPGADALPAVERRLARAGLAVSSPADTVEARRREEAAEAAERRRMAAATALCLAALVTGAVLQWWTATPRPVVVGILVVAYVAGGFFSTRRVIGELREGEITVDLLMLAAALGAASIGAWIEGATLLFLFSLSNTLESFVLGRTRHAIEALMDLAPDEAVVRRDGVETRVPVEALAIGDVVIVRPAERIAADGIVRSGTTAVDQSPMTGESMPVEKQPGDHVFAGTLNQHGAIEIEVEHLAAESTLARMVHMVAEAQTERARAQSFTDWFGQRYTIAVLAAAALTLLAGWLLFGEAFSRAFYRSMTVLVVASPCAVVISIPATILAAITRAARRGVLVKGGRHLEAAASLRAIAFDKTGTLTVGRPRVVDVLTADGGDEDALLAAAASAEGRSEHPLARAIVEAAQSRGLAVETASDTQAVVGHGVRAALAAGEVLIGKPALLRERGVDVPAELVARADEARAQGRTTVFVAVNGAARGVIVIADTLRPGAAEAMATLRRLGVEHLVMLTGDNEAVARAIGEEVGVGHEAELLPEDKLDAIRRLRERYGAIAMVGDGINDAPSLAAADLGISLGGAGTDVALETADIVLMADELRRLPEAIGLARAAQRIIKQNLGFAFAVMGGLLLVTFIATLPLPLAVVGHEGSTVIVILNGLRLLGYRAPEA